MYRCPLCQQSLTQHHNSFVCAANHSFDLAKEGYLHLLPVQQKNSKVPGDSPLMMQSRRDFLNAGYYQPLSDAVNQYFSTVLPQQPVVLDLGCGEGYYSNRLMQALADKELKLYGLDIAKTAIKKAAKSYPAIKFCVASAWHLPFADQSFDAALKLCAPCEPQELARVLKTDGLLLAAVLTALAEHLGSGQTARLDMGHILPGCLGCRPEHRRLAGADAAPRRWRGGHRQQPHRATDQALETWR